MGGNLCFSYMMQGKPSQVLESMSPTLLTVTANRVSAYYVPGKTANPASGVLKLSVRPSSPGRPADPSPAHLHPVLRPDGWGRESVIYLFFKISARAPGRLVCAQSLDTLGNNAPAETRDCCAHQENINESQNSKTTITAPFPIQISTFNVEKALQ